MQKTILFSVLGVIMSLSSFAQPGQGKGITFTPMLHNFHLDKAGKATSVLKLYNNINRDYTLDVKIVDWEKDTSGLMHFLPPNTNATSCANWITLDKNIIELEANGEGTVDITMNVPDSATAVEQMKWCMLLVTTMTEKTAPKRYGQIQSQLTQRFGAQVIVANTPPQLTLKEVRMRSFEELEADSVRRFMVACENTGELMLRCIARLEISNNSTGKKTKVDSDEFTIFPNDTRKLVVRLPENLEKGSYTIVAFIDPQDDEVPLEAAQKVITIE